MPTECNPELFEFAPVGRRAVVAGFDGGAIASDAGALLLGATDRAIGLMSRFAGCFHASKANAHTRPSAPGNSVEANRTAQACGGCQIECCTAESRSPPPPGLWQRWVMTRNSLIEHNG